MLTLDLGLWGEVYLLLILLPYDLLGEVLVQIGISNVLQLILRGCGTQVLPLLGGIVKHGIIVDSLGRNSYINVVTEIV